MKKIRLCPMCGNLGQQGRADDEVAYRVLSSVRLDMRAVSGKWCCRVWVCDSCQTPTVELYPAGMAQTQRRVLLGINDEPLVIAEE